MNFEFNLENGKHQFKTGLYCLIASIAMGVLTAILLAAIEPGTARTVIGIIFVIASAALAIVTAIKLIFGIVVYHAERTAGRNSPVQQ